MNNKIATTIRISEETKTALEDIARIEKRSFNLEVEYILETFVFEYLQKLEKKEEQKKEAEASKN